MKLLWDVMECSNQAAVQRDARRVHSSTPSEISLYTLRNHCIKFGALDHCVMIKTITGQTNGRKGICNAVLKQRL